MPNDLPLDLHEQQFNRDIQNELTLYRNTGDARFVWKAIMRFQKAGKALPIEFLDKLAEWGGRIQQLSDADEIGAALELTGSRKEPIGPKHSLAYRLRWRLASEVQTIYEARGGKKKHGSLSGAIAAVAASRGQTVAKVKKAYHDVFTASKAQDTAPGLADVMRLWR